MRRFLLVIVLAVMWPAAWGLGDPIVPVSPTGMMSATAHELYAEIFLKVTDASNPMGLPVGIYNDIAIGYTRDANGNGVLGDNAFVLYTGARAATAAAPVVPGKILSIDPTGGAIQSMLSGTNEWAGKSQGRLFAAGMILAISDPMGGAGAIYNLGDGDTNPRPQLTFTVYNAYIQNIQLDPMIFSSTGGRLFTTIQTSGDHPVHMDIYADLTPDAGVTAPAGGMRYQSSPGTRGERPELPLRDIDAAGTLLANLDNGTYYDRNASGWGRLAWAGDPADDDKVMWSFVGNPNTEFRIMQTFGTSAAHEKILMTWDAGTPGDPSDDLVIPVNTSGLSNLLPDSQLEGEFVPGASLAPADKLTPDGKGFLNSLLVDGRPYVIGGSFAYGGLLCGAYDSDPNTWTFQQEPNALTTATRLSGPMVPEPGVLCLLAGGALLLVLKRRRRVRISP